MLSCNRAAQSQGFSVEIRPGGLSDFPGTRVVALEHEVRMEVAISGMPEGRYPHAVRLPHSIDGLQHLGDPAARHANVFHPHGAQPLEGSICRPS